MGTTNLRAAVRRAGLDLLAKPISMNVLARLAQTGGLVIKVPQALTAVLVLQGTLV